LLVPFDSEVRKRVCPQNDANFGIGALKRPPLDLNRRDSHEVSNERVFRH